MQKIGFAEALDSIVASDPRYQREAYVFLRDALDYTTKQQKKTKGASVRHVAGPELLEGVRQYALKEFGQMVVTVLSYWGVRSTEEDRKSTRLNSSHSQISYAVFCLKKKKDLSALTLRGRPTTY